jgi:hypothetical protein
MGRIMVGIVAVAATFAAVHIHGRLSHGPGAERDSITAVVVDSTTVLVWHDLDPTVRVATYTPNEQWECFIIQGGTGSVAMSCHRRVWP